MEFTSSAEQNFMKRLLEVIDANLHDENFGVTELAAELGMSRSTLHRKVKSVVNKSVNEFIRETRLKRAHQLLEEKDRTVSEIAYEVGFRSVSYFNRSFRDQFGYTPGDVQKGLVKNSDKKVVSPISQRKIRTGFWLVVGVSFVLISIMVWFLFIIPGKDVEKTLAVLPFDTENTQLNNSYNAEWIVREIINKIEKVDNLIVVPYSDIRNYNKTGKRIAQIGKELKVSYVLDGSVIQSDSQLKIHFELIETKKGESVWQEIMVRPVEFSTMAEAFDIQKDVALKVANELQISLTPGDKLQLAAYPTSNVEAYKKYILADGLLKRNDKDWDDIHYARSLLKQAIQLDSSFSEAYSRLGQVYGSNLSFIPDLYLAASYLDTAKTLYEKALSLDQENKAALTGLFSYYKLKGQPDVAKQFEPKQNKGVKNYLYYKSQAASNYFISNPVRKIEAFYNYLETKPDDEVTPGWMLEHVFEVYMRMGFPELAQKYSKEMHMVQHKGPVPKYCYHTALIEEFNGHYDSAFVHVQKAYEKNPGEKPNYLMLAARNSMRQRNYAEACTYLDEMEKEGEDENWLEMLSHLSRLMYPFGYSYLMTGQQEKGEYYLKRLTKRYEDEIETNWVLAQLHYTYIELAMVYSALGEEEKALQCLSAVLDKGACQLWFIMELEKNPMFDRIRDRTEYDSLLEAFRNNYNRERQLIEKLLIKKGIRPA